MAWYHDYSIARRIMEMKRKRHLPLENRVTSEEEMEMQKRLSQGRAILKDLYNDINSHLVNDEWVLDEEPIASLCVYPIGRTYKTGIIGGFDIDDTDKKLNGIILEGVVSTPIPLFNEHAGGLRKMLTEYTNLYNSSPSSQLRIPETIKSEDIYSIIWAIPNAPKPSKLNLNF